MIKNAAFLLLLATLLAGCDPNQVAGDADGDGVAADAGDCNDDDPSVYPDAPDIACDGIDQDCDGADFADLDNDGVTACAGADPFDCNDEDPDVFPGNTEICDAVDHDCDGTVDNGLPEFSWWEDADGDGHGTGTIVVTCEDVAPSETSVSADGAEDCDDTDATTSPSATETCDGRDDTCDGVVDEGFDADGDGVTTCGPNGDVSTADDDCDDADAANFPGNTEVCDAADNNCDAAVDEGFDVDGDTVTTCGPDGVAATADDDCDDAAPTNFPGNLEICDAADNNCDATVDEGFDVDGDGVTSCGVDGAPATADDDCDDANAANFPGNTEVCDAADNDCDGAAGPGEVDADADGYVVCTLVTGASTPGIVGGDDCDDAQALVYPSAVEVCDGLDNDCSGSLEVDESDEDGDLWLTCAGFVDVGLGFAGGGDCDDSAAIGAACNPGLAEVCDLMDNNCDTTVDEGFDSDADGVFTCGPDGVVGTADDDCDDNDAAILPGANEICDGIDNDCDTDVDGADSGYLGNDADGDGQAGIPCGGLDCDDFDATLTTYDLDLDGESSCAGDCNDEHPGFNTSRPEACDGEDNDCNGLVDDGVEPDADGDGFVTVGCGFGGDDCMDTDAHVFPDDTYTSGYQKQCLPALRPGFATSWAHGRLNLPTYFQDPQTGTHYLYFRGHHNTAFNQIGYATSANGTMWGAIQGPVLSEDPTVGAWDGRKISHPTVAYIPGKARPYIMLYHAQDDSAPNRRLGIATATTAGGDPVDGTFKRLDLGGSTVTNAVIDTSPNVTAVDNEQVVNPSVWYDDVTGLLHLWYTGRFGSPNQFAIASAICDTTISDCGTAADWVKVDSNGDGDPDVWIEGTDGAWDDDNVQQTFVMAHSDAANNAFGYELEVFYTGAGLSIGAMQGDIDDATSWVESGANPVVEPSLATERFDSESTTGRGVRYDDVAGNYHMYYGTSVALPEDGNGQGTDILWGPGNYSGGASYIGHAINAAPEVVVATADCSSISGDITDNAPDTVQLTVWDGGVMVAGPFAGTSTGNSDTAVQTTTFSETYALAAGTHELVVVAQDLGGAERNDTITVTCP